MIHHWIETGTATLQQLIEGLGVVGRNDLVADIKKLIKNKNYFFKSLIFVTIIFLFCVSKLLFVNLNP